MNNLYTCTHDEGVVVIIYDINKHPYCPLCQAKQERSNTEKDLWERKRIIKGLKEKLRGRT